MPDGAAAPDHQPDGFLDSARALAVCTVRDAIEDRAPGLAAEVAFFSILALPPLVLGLFGLAGFISDLIGPVNTEEVRDWVVDVASDFLSQETIDDAVIPTTDAVFEDGRADVAVFGLVLAVWSASRATNVTMRAMTIAYDLEGRPAWRRRAVALGITAVGMLVGLAVVPALVLGPRIAGYLGAPDVVDTAWRIAYWPGTALVATGLLASLYHVAAPWKTPWRRDVPGAVLAVTMWLASAAVLRVYAAWAIRSDSTYGPLATPIVVLLWLYVTAFAVIMGAEFNAEIEKLWPHRRARPVPEAGEPASGVSEELAAGDEAVQA